MPNRATIATALIAATIGLTAISSAQDAPTYRAGLRSFIIPAPSPDLVETGSDYRVLLEPLVPTSNRLVAAFLRPSELDMLRSGTSSQLGRYATVEISRRAEFADVTSDAFKQITDSIAKQFGATFEANLKDQQDEMNRRLKALGSSSGNITLDKPVQLGALFSKPDACAVGMIVPVSSGGKTTKMAMGMGVVRAKSRVLFLYTYTEYKDESSVEWIRSTDELWADAFLEANK